MPNGAREDTSLATVLEMTQKSGADEMHTASVGRVVSYNAALQRADIEVVITRPLTNALGEVLYEELGTMAQIPVLFPRCGKFSITFPLEKGDTVLLVYLENSIGEWRTGTEIADPADTGRHSARYPVAIPGIFPDTKPSPNAVASPEDLVVGAATGVSKMIVKPSEILLGFGATVPIAMSNKTDAAILALQAKLDSFIAAYNTHTHTVTAIPVTNATPAGPGPVTASGATLVPSATSTPVGTQPTTASLLVKSL